MRDDDEIVQRLTRYLTSGNSQYEVSKELLDELVNYTYGKYTEYEIEDKYGKTSKYQTSDMIDTLGALMQKERVNAEANKPAPVVKMLNISNLDSIKDQFFHVDVDEYAYTFYVNFQNYVVVNRKIYGLSDNEPYVSTALYVNNTATKNDKITLKGNTLPPIEQIKEQLKRVANYR